MNLPVMPEKNENWYKQGLKFTCTCCGNCCTGGPGYVWITEEEIRRLAVHLNLTPEETVEQHCRKINGKWSLKEARSVSGSYDCTFLKEIKPPRTNRKGNAIVQAKRVCGIYEVRPLQCRTWPFWPENLESKADWAIETRKCPGMDTGTHYSVAQIEALRDSHDWPVKAPGSGKKMSVVSGPLSVVKKRGNNPQPTTNNPQRTTHNGQPTTNNPQRTTDH